MFRNRTIGFQLTAGFSIAVTVMIIIAIAGIAGLDAVQDNVNELHVRQLPAIDFLIQADRDLQQGLVA